MDRLVVRWEKVIEVELGVPRRMVMEKVVDAPFVVSFSGIQGIPEQCTL
jgi:hypothetical protein